MWLLLMMIVQYMACIITNLYMPFAEFDVQLYLGALGKIDTIYNINQSVIQYEICLFCRFAWHTRHAWHDLLTHLIHRVPSRSAGLLSTHVMLDDDVLRSEGVIRTIHRGDPIIRPPVLEVRREQMTEYLICSMHHTIKQM
jgi:hypothetical protein